MLIVALLGTPPTVDFTSQSPGAPINVSLQTVGSLGTGSHPTWVSYLVRSPQGQWVHTTVFQVPQHTRINVTIYQYDSGSPLRNQQLGQVTGTAGNVATLNGKLFRVINSNVRQRRRPHLHHPRARHQRAALRATTTTPTCAARRRARRARRTT